MNRMSIPSRETKAKKNVSLSFSHRKFSCAASSNIKYEQHHSEQATIEYYKADSVIICIYSCVLSVHSLLFPI